MRLAATLMALQEKLPRLEGRTPDGSRSSGSTLRALLFAYGFLTTLSAVYMLRHAGSPEALYRYPGLPAFSICLIWVVMLASELLRRGHPEEGHISRRRLASAVLAVVGWFVLVPALLLFGIVHSHAVSGTTGVLGWAAFFVFLSGLFWIVGRYSGPVRRGSGH